jgi:hypothetical protein
VYLSSSYQFIHEPNHPPSTKLLIHPSIHQPTKASTPRSVVCIFRHCGNAYCSSGRHRCESRWMRCILNSQKSKGHRVHSKKEKKKKYFINACAYVFHESLYQMYSFLIAAIQQTKVVLFLEVSFSFNSALIQVVYCWLLEILSTQDFKTCMWCSYFSS